MENKELKKPIPEELNDELLEDVAAGGIAPVPQLPETQNNQTVEGCGTVITVIL